MITLDGVNFDRLDERELIRRVLANMHKAKPPHGTWRWAKVSETFGVGSTAAHCLCNEFGFDPDERVRQ